MIGHTQPRRIAARNVAARIAQELGSELGGLVGYKVRFGDRGGPSTYVKVMTDGILLAETQGRDPLSNETLREQTRFLVDYFHRLFRWDDPTSAPTRQGATT